MSEKYNANRLHSALGVKRQGIASSSSTKIPKMNEDNFY